MNDIAKSLVRDKSGLVLVLFRSHTHPKWPHQPDLPGGDVEPSEERIAGVIREILEETGMTVMREQVTGEFAVQYRRPTTIYTFEITEDAPHVTLSWEHECYAWLTSQAARLLFTEDSVVRQALDALETRK